MVKALVLRPQLRRVDACEAARLLGGVSARRARQIAEGRGWDTEYFPALGGKKAFYLLEDVLGAKYEETTTGDPSTPLKAEGNNAATDSGAIANPEAARRLRIIAPIINLEHGRKSQAVSEAATSHGVSERTIRRWMSAYEKHGDAGLGSGKTGNNNAAKANIAAEIYITTIFNSCFAPTLEQVFKTYESERKCNPDRGLPEISRSTLLNTIHRLGHSLTRTRRGGDRSRAMKKLAPTIHRDWTKVRVMGCWMGDGTALDLLVKHPRYEKPIRAWFLAWMDVRSRYIVSWRLVDKVNGATAQMALRDGWHKYGLPDELYIDNGKEYVNNNSLGFRIDDEKCLGFMERVGVKMHRAWVRNPESKAQIERFFATFSGSYLSVFDGYTGGNITSKTRVKDDARLKADLKANRIYTMDEARALIGQILNAYHSAPHRGLNGLAPAKVFNDLYGRSANGVREEQVAHMSDSVLNFATMRRRLVKRIDTCRGVALYNTFYRSEENAFQFSGGKRAILAWDPEDTSRTWLYLWENGKEKFLCELYPDFGVNPKNEQEMRAAIAEQKRKEKLIKEAAFAMIDKKVDVAAHLRRGVLACDDKLIADHEERFPTNSEKREPADLLRFPKGGADKPPENNNPIEDAEESRPLKGLFGVL